MQWNNSLICGLKELRRDILSHLFLHKKRKKKSKLRHYDPIWMRSGTIMAQERFPAFSVFGKHFLPIPPSPPPSPSSWATVWQQQQPILELQEKTTFFYVSFLPGDEGEVSPRRAVASPPDKSSNAAGLNSHRSVPTMTTASPSPSTSRTFPSFPKAWGKRWFKSVKKDGRLIVCPATTGYKLVKVCFFTFAICLCLKRNSIVSAEQFSLSSWECSTINWSKHSLWQIRNDADNPIKQSKLHANT